MTVSPMPVKAITGTRLEVCGGRRLEGELRVSGAKKSVKLSLYVCKVQGVNASAKEALQRAHSDKTAGLMGRIRDLPLFLGVE